MKIVGSLGMAVVITGMGLVLGIVPGLLLGLIGWHTTTAIIMPIIWWTGYIRQRSRNYGHVDWITYSVGAFGGLGLGIGIWFFGNITLRG